MPPETVVVLEDVRLIFRNFAGRASDFNAEGDRNFAILLDERTADTLASDGWNVKTRVGREEGDPPIFYLPVGLKYRARDGRRLKPPRVVMITSRNRTSLTEDEVEMLDWSDILRCDVVIRPFEWVLGAKSGLKAYLKSMFVTIDEDPLERKYAAMDD